MMMSDVSPSASKPAHRPPWWAIVSAGVAVAALAVGGWLFWARETHKDSQATAKDEVTRALDAMVQGIGASRQDYTSGVALEHCDNGVGGYDGWRVYSEGAFHHQTRDGAVTMADALSAYLRRAGYSGVTQTVDAQRVRVEGSKDGIKAVLFTESSGGGDTIDITAATGCDVVPDPAVATSDRVIIG